MTKSSLDTWMRLTGLGVFALALAFLPSSSPAAEAPTEPRGQSSGAGIKLEPADPSKSRKQILAEFYEQLRKAPDDESAALIAAAIEKLWLKSGSATVDLLIVRAALLAKEEDYDTALEILNSVVAIAPDYSEGWNQRATIFFRKKEFHRSLNDIRRVLRLDRRHYKAINGLGLILQELGDKKAALKAFRHMLEVYPKNDSARQSAKELSRDVEGQGI